MKKCISQATKVLAIISFVSISVPIVGIVLIVVKSPKGALNIGLTILGGFLTVLFVALYFAERSRFVTIDSDKISLPRGVDINGKTVFKRTIVRFNEIASLESKHQKGVFLITKDTHFYAIKLNMQ